MRVDGAADVQRVAARIGWGELENHNKKRIEWPMD
jgi:hypothetical protein